MPFITDPELKQLDETAKIEARAEELYNEIHHIPQPQEWQAPKLDDEGPSFGETVGAAFSEENILGAMAQDAELKGEVLGTETIQTSRRGVRHRRLAPGFSYDENYNVFDEDLSGYEEFIDEFDDVGSKKEFEFVKKQIDKGRENRKILAESGGLGIASMIGAGILDPTTFIPIAGTGYKVTKIGKAIHSGLIAAGSVGAIEAGRETILHHYQPVRTLEESALNVGGATILAGVLGGFAGKLASGKHEKIAAEIDDYLEAAVHTELPILRHGSGGAAAVAETTLEQETLVGGKFIEALTIGPSGRLAQSPSLEARKVGQALVEDPWLRKKHQEGIATTESWETLIKQRDRDLDDAVRTLKKEWREYSNRVPKEERAFLNYNDFDEAVGAAMRRGDESDIAEVSRAAKALRKKYDKIKKEAIEAGLFDEGVSALGALSYLPRAYNRAKIVANRNAFRRELERELSSKISEDSEDYLEDIVDNIINNILGARDKAGSVLSGNAAKSLKSRNLELSDEFLEKWLDSSAHNLYASYHRSMVPRTTWSKKFGKDTLADVKKSIRTEYDELTRRTKSQKELRKLDKKMQSDLDDVQRMYERAMGIQNGGLNSRGGTARTLAAAKEINRQRLLGGVWLSSLADTARPIVVNGLGRYSSMIYKMATNPAVAKLAMAEKRRLAAALEITEQTRLSKMADVTDDMMDGTKAERAIKWTGEKFSAATLLPRHNSIMKTLVGLLTEDKIIRFANKLQQGKRISKKEIQKLARLGIDENAAKRIAAQYKKYGETVDGLTVGNFDDWDDLAARNAIDSAIIKMADETINTPGIGTLPNFFDNKIAQVIGQFKSFLVASHNQTLLAGLQQADMHFATSMIAMVGIGALVTEIKDTLAGRDKSRNPVEMLVEAVDRSGVLSVPMEINNITDKMTNHTISVNALVGGNEAKRYATRNKLEALLGPSASLASDLMTTGDIISNGEIKESDIHRYRKLLPFQNLWYTRNVMDKLEEGLSEALGAK